MVRAKTLDLNFPYCSLLNKRVTPFLSSLSIFKDLNIGHMSTLGPWLPRVMGSFDLPVSNDHSCGEEGIQIKPATAQIEVKLNCTQA